MEMIIKHVFHVLHLANNNCFIIELKQSHLEYIHDFKYVPIYPSYHFGMCAHCLESLFYLLIITEIIHTIDLEFQNFLKQRRKTRYVLKELNFLKTPVTHRRKNRSFQNTQIRTQSSMICIFIWIGPRRHLRD